MALPGVAELCSSGRSSADRQAWQVDAAQFQRALRQICGQMPAERLQRYTSYILESSAAF